MSTELEDTLDSLSIASKTTLTALPRELRDKIYQCLGARLEVEDLSFGAVKVKCRHLFGYTHGKFGVADLEKSAGKDIMRWGTLLALRAVSHQLNAEILSLVTDHSVLCFEMDDKILDFSEHRKSSYLPNDPNRDQFARNLPASFSDGLITFNISTVVFRPCCHAAGAPHALNTYRHTMKRLAAMPNSISRLIIVPPLPHPALQYFQDFAVRQGTVQPSSLTFYALTMYIVEFKKLELVEMVHKNNLSFKKKISELKSVVKDRELADEMGRVYNPWYNEQYLTKFWELKK